MTEADEAAIAGLDQSAWSVSRHQDGSVAGWREALNELAIAYPGRIR